ncbi:MAG: tetratricopeptide repeat protein, partial [Terriglobales bacterium]
EEAVAINDRYTRAYVNLAMLAFPAGKYTEAEELLEKAVASEPRDVEALALLAQAQLMTGKLDAAILNARRVHELPHEKFALVHLIAAHCFQAKKDADQAMVEYQIFLREDPKSERAPRARAALETLQKTIH